MCNKYEEQEITFSVVSRKELQFWSIPSPNGKFMRKMTAIDKIVQSRQVTESFSNKRINRKFSCLSVMLKPHLTDMRNGLAVQDCAHCI